MNLKKIILYLILIIIIFSLDRVSKIYIINLAEIENKVDLYINEFLNLYLIWNKGIAFGFFSSEQNVLYNSITLLIFFIMVGIVIWMIRVNGYSRIYLALILGGSFSNFFDRIYYRAVPDFIDFHIKSFHWFVFNVADIFITTGVFCLILAEIISENKIKNESI
ncbi:signal peptidase II [Candidatus Pelagibacter sp.]|jgi:signal peptidase II|nr:signal peptidase II [Candidatus Pelagibacter sp.]